MGCGHALPACILYRYALQHSIPIKQVLLSDYNDFVLRQLTCPNIILNTPQQQQQQHIIITNDNQQQNDKKNLDNNNNDVVLFTSGDWFYFLQTDVFMKISKLSPSAIHRRQLRN